MPRGLVRPLATTGAAPAAGLAEGVASWAATGRTMLTMRSVETSTAKTTETGVETRRKATLLCPTGRLGGSRDAVSYEIRADCGLWHRPAPRPQVLSRLEDHFSIPGGDRAHARSRSEDRWSARCPGHASSGR